MLSSLSGSSAGLIAGVEAEQDRLAGERAGSATRPRGRAPARGSPSADLSRSRQKALGKRSQVFMRRLDWRRPMAACLAVVESGGAKLTTPARARRGCDDGAVGLDEVAGRHAHAAVRDLDGADLASAPDVEALRQALGDFVISVGQHHVAAAILLALVEAARRQRARGQRAANSCSPSLFSA
ncbi:MAG: hypothetical protein U1F43_10295 [Myxococcota bacterium]